GVMTNAEARSVASFHSIPEVKFENLAPVARLEIVRPVVAIENQVNCQRVQLDVKSAVENDKLENEVYVEQPQVSRLKVQMIKYLRNKKSLS
ncbi:copia protein, partial [Trifolium pratense]